MSDEASHFFGALHKLISEGIHEDEHLHDSL